MRKQIVAFALSAAMALSVTACSLSAPRRQTGQGAADQEEETARDPAADAGDADATGAVAASDDASDAVADANTPNADDLRAALNITERYYDDLSHGEKPAAYQKYIVLHDTEGESSPADTIDWWESNGSYVAAHFVVGRDGSIYQCVPLDCIAHHAGYGETGNNEAFGVTDQSRDDMRGTASIGSAYADYGMNSCSVGIEMVHVGGSGDYPAAQLAAVDGLIAYIDAYYGFESTIIDHKTWRPTNSDTSAEFAAYLANYQATRTHDGSAR